MEGKFILRDFQGNPVSHWFVRRVNTPQPKIEKTVGHHIIIVDRSGSMWGVMDDTKQMVEKVMTVAEFHDANLLLSLLSYSSAGDLTVHFSRIPVQEVNKPNSNYIQELRQIQASCLTCASQALEEAEKLIGTETTAVSLHTDGWFNDRSPAEEKKRIEKIRKTWTDKPNVFVNTIAYGSYSDFNYLAKIANSMSGASVLAQDVKSVYSALHDTTSLLAGRTMPAIPLGLDGADWQVALNLSQKKVNGAATDLTIRGMGENDDLRVYRFSQVVEGTYARASTPDCDRNAEGLQVLAAFARTKLAEGRINEAKYALTTMRLPEVLKKHYNALSSNKLAAFAQDLDGLMTTTDFAAFQRTDTYGFDLKNDLKGLFNYLAKNTDGFAVHMPSLLATYQRRGIARLEGKFDDNGVFVPNDISLVEDTTFEEDPLVQVTSFSANTAEATINMTTARPAVLMKNGKKVPRVAGRKLDLSLMRSYTLVGDGEVLVDQFPIVVSDVTVLNRLISDGFIPADTQLNETVSIALPEFPVVPMAQSALPAPTSNDLQNYAKLLVQAKLYAAILPAEAKGVQEWTPEQVEELRMYNLTPNLSFSAPTTNHYTDKNKAASEGLIDSYTKYTVSLGNNLATDLRSSLWSANEYLARRFTIKLPDSTVEVDKEGFVKKPKFDMLRLPDVEIGIKTLSARTKLTPLDHFVYPIFNDFLMKQLPTLTIEEAKEKLELTEAQIHAYEKYFSDFSMVLGSTGLVPDDWQAEIIPADNLVERHPDIDMPKGHKEGTFFGVNDIYIGVHPEVAWYTTSKGMQQVEQLR
jgi:hypothetical protein